MPTYFASFGIAPFTLHAPNEFVVQKFATEQSPSGPLQFNFAAALGAAFPTVIVHGVPSLIVTGVIENAGVGAVALHKLVDASHPYWQLAVVEG